MPTHLQIQIPRPVQVSIVWSVVLIFSNDNELIVSIVDISEMFPLESFSDLVSCGDDGCMYKISVTK